MAALGDLSLLFCDQVLDMCHYGGLNYGFSPGLQGSRIILARILKPFPDTGKAELL